MKKFLKKLGNGVVIFFIFTVVYLCISFISSDPVFSPTSPVIQSPLEKLELKMDTVIVKSHKYYVVLRGETGVGITHAGDCEKCVRE